MGSKSNDKCLYKRTQVAKNTEENTGSRRNGDVEKETEIRAVQPQTQGHWQPPEAGRGRKRSMCNRPHRKPCSDEYYTSTLRLFYSTSISEL